MAASAWRVPSYRPLTSRKCKLSIFQEDEVGRSRWLLAPALRQGEVHVFAWFLCRGRCNRENAKLSRLRKKRWVESLESRGKQLQNVVNLFITALRQPTDARTAITLSALVGAERLWPSYRAIVDSAHEVGTSERLVSFPRAIPPRDMEAMAQLCQDDLELLMALGASPASFLLVAKNQTVVFLSSTFCSMTGIPPEELTGRKFGALLVRSKLGALLRSVFWFFEANHAFVACRSGQDQW